MRREELLFVATCDIAGQVRGKAYPASDIDARRNVGVGWTHSNLMQTAFGPILDTPFGTAGDLMIVPDPNVTVRVDYNDDSAAEHFALGDIRNTDGTPWECCPREFLRQGLATLRDVAGVNLFAAFEQEFVYTGVEDRPGHAYSLGAFRRQGMLGEALSGALQMAGVTPDSFLPEYGSRQYEITIAPRLGVTAADQAIITREIARATAHRLGHRVIFSPMVAPDGVGNGTHIHFSLQDADRKPLTWDGSKPFGLSDLARRFCAGVLHHLPAITAITAPSPVSYLRLTPNRWAPTRVDLVMNDRGAALRVCPVFGPRDDADRARQYNMEFRVADATASPYMALGALVRAGADGIARGLELPTGEPPALPASLAEALRLMEASETVRGWFSPVFLEAYLRHKRSEIAHVAGMNAAQLCDAYAAIY
jgi:glutamine synthetase